MAKRVSPLQTSFFTALTTHGTSRNVVLKGTDVTIRFRRGEQPSTTGEDVWAPYIPHAITDQAPAHPTPLRRPGIQTLCAPPAIHSTISIDKGYVENGAISREQLECIARASEAFDSTSINEDDEEIRLGYAAAMGTGTGKTTIALGTFLNERRKSNNFQPTLIVSSSQLIGDVFRAQAEELSMNPQWIQNIKTSRIEKLYRLSPYDGEIFITTYAQMRRKTSPITIPMGKQLLQDYPDHPANPRLEKAIAEAHGTHQRTFRMHIADIVGDMLGSDALYIWDECDLMRNNKSDQGRAYVRINKENPDAKMLFLSASMTPHPKAMTYISDRIGLCGKQSIFKSKEKLFKFSRKSTQNAESVVTEAISRGTMSIAGLSYEGIQYNTVHVQLQAAHRARIDYLSGLIESIAEYAWQRGEVFRVQAEKKKAIPKFSIPGHAEISNMLPRFYQAIGLDLCREALFSEIDTALERGEQIVIQVAETGQSNLNYSRKNGNVQVSTSHLQRLSDYVDRLVIPFRSKIVYAPDGTATMHDRDPEKTKAMRDSFKDALNISIQNDHILTELATRYGDLFTEVSGRSERTWRTSNNTFATAKRKPLNDNRQAITDFNAGRKRILAVSSAGSRGIELHAAAAFENRAQRHLMVFDPLPSITDFLQGLGRLCRTGQVSWPKVTFFAPDIPGFQVQLGKIIHKLNVAGACSYGDHRTLSIPAEIPVFANANGITAVQRFIEDARSGKSVVNLKHLMRSLRYERKKISKLKAEEIAHGFLRRLIGLPLDIQEQTWETLVAYKEKATIVSSGEGTAIKQFRKNDITITETRTTKNGTLYRIEYNEPTMDLYTWDAIHYNRDPKRMRYVRLTDGTVGAVYTFLPVHSANGIGMFNEHQISTPYKAEGISGNEALMYEPISQEEAKILWEHEIASVPLRHEKIWVYSGSIQSLTDLCEEQGVSVNIEPDEYRIFTTARGERILGVVLDPKDITSEELTNFNQEALLSA